jgi:hypothetical protein
MTGRLLRRQWQSGVSAECGVGGRGGRPTDAAGVAAPIGTSRSWADGTARTPHARSMPPRLAGPISGWLGVPASAWTTKVAGEPCRCSAGRLCQLSAGRLCRLSAGRLCRLAQTRRTRKGWPPPSQRISLGLEPQPQHGGHPTDGSMPRRKLTGPPRTDGLPLDQRPNRGASPARPFPSLIFLDKNRRDIGKSQSIWTDAKMETTGSQQRTKLQLSEPVAPRQPDVPRAELLVMMHARPPLPQQPQTKPPGGGGRVKW